jgi:hypothetical protein
VNSCPECSHPYPAYCRCVRILARGSGRWLPPLGAWPGSWRYPDDGQNRPPSVADAKRLTLITDVWDNDLWEMVWGASRAMNKARGKTNDGYRLRLLVEKRTGA